MKKWNEIPSEQLWQREGQANKIINYKIFDNILLDSYMQTQTIKLIGSSIVKPTKAIFVRGPRATKVTSPGYLLACSTRKVAADCSIGFPFGGGKFWLPSPSAPWTKSAMRSFVPFLKTNKQCDNFFQLESILSKDAPW